jgi:hypothetical protein
VPYLAAPPSPIAAAPAAAAPLPPKAQTETAESAPAAAPRAETVAASQPAAQPDGPPSQPAVRKQAAGGPEDSFAKARDADITRPAVEKRRTERGKQRAEKRRSQQRRKQELLQFEEKVREETEPRRKFASEPERAEMPRVRLFDLD